MREPLEPRDDFEKIRRLISAEEEEALARFRKGDFEAELRARLAAAASDVPKRSPLSLLRPIAVPVGAAALLIVLASAAFLLFLRHAGTVGGGTASFAEAVGMLPGLADIQTPSLSSLPQAGPTASAAGPVGEVLARAFAQKRAEEDRSPAPAAALAAPRLSLKKKMEILFKDQVLERVLVSIHEKSKEV